MPENPWTFGWTELLTIAALCITSVFGALGLRRFDSWRREKIEERRIEVALEALTLAYEARLVFERIRSPMSHGVEWADMPKVEGESELVRDNKGPFYAVHKRIRDEAEYFERVLRLLPRFAATISADGEDLFISILRARREVEVSAGMLMRQAAQPERHQYNEDLQNRMEADIWDMGGAGEAPDRVGEKVTAFRAGIERICLPIVRFPVEAPPPIKRDAN